MASEQFSLCWDNFHKNMSSGMNSLLENEDLVDVTLAVEGKCLKAHKMVLSVCSPYFKELFKSNPCQHPIVFMKDVSYVALSDLLQFMYQGEVQVSQENLTTFIKTAEALQIKGLTGDGNGSADTDAAEPPVHEKPVHQIEDYKPVPRPKKQAITPPTPPVKRPRLSVSSSESQPLPPAVAKTEPASSTPGGAVTEPPVQFKMEPYDQTQSLIDDTGDETFGDDNLDDANVDDTEDYSMMEGGVGEEEPQAGTSTDGAGEGQDAVFQIEVIKHLITIITILNRQDVTMERMKRNINIIAQRMEGKVKSEDVSRLLDMLPLKTEEDLNQMEYLLTDEGTSKELTHVLATTGGINFKDCSRRILSKVMDTNLALKYSYKGHKNKKDFSKTKISKIILDAVVSNFRTTEREVELTIAVWLAKAKFRVENNTTQ